MDRSLILAFDLVGTSGTFCEISWNSKTVFSAIIYEGHWLSVGRILEIQQEVRSHAINPFTGYGAAGNVLVLENDNSYVNRIGIELGAG